MSKAAAKKSTLAKKREQSSTATCGSQVNTELEGLQIEDLQEQIRQRAYQLFELRCGRDGDELQDWLRAKAEIAAELNRK